MMTDDFDTVVVVPIWLAFFVWLIEAAIMLALAALAVFAYVIIIGYRSLEGANEARQRRRVESRIALR